MNKYSNNKTISFYSVGIAYHRQSLKEVSEKERELNIGIPSFFCKNDSLNKEFFNNYVRMVPTVVIVNRNGRVVYVGEGSYIYNRTTYNNIDNLIRDLLINDD